MRPKNRLGQKWRQTAWPGRDRRARFWRWGISKRSRSNGGSHACANWAPSTRRVRINYTRKEQKNARAKETKKKTRKGPDADCTVRLKIMGSNPDLGTTFFLLPQKKLHWDFCTSSTWKKTHTCQFVWPRFDFRKFHFSKLQKNDGSIGHDFFAWPSVGTGRRRVNLCEFYITRI